MTWNELKEEAKKMGLFVAGGDSMTQEHIWVKDNLCLYKGGKVVFDDMDVVENYILSCNRTPDQMLAIMKALQ